MEKTDFEILEMLVDEIPPEAWDMIPRKAKEAVLNRIYQKPEYNQGGESCHSYT